MHSSFRVPGPCGRQQQQQHSRQQHHPVTGRCRTTSHVSATAASAAKKQHESSTRNAQLYELFDDDGWGVEVASQPVPPSNKTKEAAAAAAASVKPQPARQPKQQQQQQQGRVKGKRGATPYADMRSEAGKLGLTLLHRVLLEEEEQQQQQQAAAGVSQPQKPTIKEIKDRLAAASSNSKKLKPKLPGYPSAAAAAGAVAAAGAAGAAAGRQLFAGADSELYDYDDEDEDYDEDESEPEFQITFDEQGRAEFTDFRTGATSIPDDEASSSPAAAAAAEEEDFEDFGLSGWGQFDDGSAAQQQQQLEVEEEQQQPLFGVGGRAQRSAGQGQTAAEDDEVDLALLRDLSNEDDWGLESLSGGAAGFSGRLAQPGGRRSLVDELTAAEEADAAAGLSGDGSYGGSVQWGGSAGTTGIDLQEQEAILQRYFRPDQVKKLMKEQEEVVASYSELRKRAVGMGASDHKLQEKLRIVAGTAAGRKLVSFRSTQTRPMMEKVRQAIFNMLQSRAGTLNCLPKHARWLDLFAGTGSVGLEALSRGVKEAHFVEMDPVVVSKILNRNIKGCGFSGRAWTHTSKAEEFLRRSASLPRFAGGPFDFISVCPPYLLVSYPELFELLDASPLLHPGSVVFVEYPKQLAHQIADRLGPLQRVRDRRYGRTWVALYAAAGAAGDDAEDGNDDGQVEEDPFLSLQL